MQTEEQNQPIPPVPEIAPVGESKDSNESKPGRGGKRAGAGRRPNIEKRLAARLRPESAIEILTEVDAAAIFRDIFKDGSRQLKLNAWIALQDRAYGRPAQAVSVSGTVGHVHWTPGKYSHLTDEEFAKLAELSAKALAPPTLNALPDAAHNQTEIKQRSEQPAIEVSAKEAPQAPQIKPAIEAEVVESEAKSAET